MRQNSTAAEKAFWNKARNRKLFGLKWNRQFVIECQRDLLFKKYYIADLHCHALKLVVEIDGEIHNNQKSEDLVRTDELKSFGFKVVRFSNDQIINNWEEVEKVIEDLYLQQNHKIISSRV
jgi:very-short-patch-repair endonuclease